MYITVQKFEVGKVLFFLSLNQGYIFHYEIILQFKIARIFNVH